MLHENASNKYSHIWASDAVDTGKGFSVFFSQWSDLLLRRWLLCVTPEVTL